MQTRTITALSFLSIFGLNIFSLGYTNIIYAGNNNDFANYSSLSDFNFVTAGDFGCKNEAKRTVSNMISKDPTLMIALGDLSYGRNATCWLDIVSPLDKPGKVRIALGDHDIDPDLSRYNEYLRHFNLTKPYYSFNYQNVHFLAMSTAKEGVTSYGNTSEQYRFVKQDLRDAHKNKSIDWIIVFGYRPFYSSPTMHPGSDILREIYHPLFDRFGVDLVFQAHNENYQRTYPIEFNEGNDFNPTVSDKHTREYNRDPKGPIFITIGTGGRGLHNFTGQEDYVVRQFQRHGFLNVDVTDNGTNLTATFYENREGKDEDHFSIMKTRDSKQK